MSDLAQGRFCADCEVFRVEVTGNLCPLCEKTPRERARQASGTQGHTHAESRSQRHTGSLRAVLENYPDVISRLSQALPLPPPLLRHLHGNQLLAQAIESGRLVREQINMQEDE